MQQTLTRSLIETLVRSKLKDLKNSPERTTRNLVDMALHFSKGRFQKRFFEIAQTMLDNENSPYYQMVYHAVANVKQDRLLQFGMNLGYNSCTYGAGIIRKVEQQFGYNVPWCITLELNESMLKNAPEHYHQLLQEGKSLGIYTWHIISHGCMGMFLPIVEMNADCAFSIFCEPDEITESLTTDYEFIQNVMFVIKYSEHETDVFQYLQKQGFLYSAYHYYDDTDVSYIMNDDFLCSLNETGSAFAVLFPSETCSETAKIQVRNYVEDAINSPTYSILPFEFFHYNAKIDSIISDDSCSVWFDKAGNLMTDNTEVTKLNHFTHSLNDILKAAFPKNNN